MKKKAFFIWFIIGGVFLFAHSATIIRPKGGEIWMLKSIQWVAWNAATPLDGVFVQLLKNGEFIGHLKFETPFPTSAGQHQIQWKVGKLIQQKTIQPGSGYFIQIVDSFAPPGAPTLVAKSKPFSIILNPYQKMP